MNLSIGCRLCPIVYRSIAMLNRSPTPLQPGRLNRLPAYRLRAGQATTIHTLRSRQVGCLVCHLGGVKVDGDVDGCGDLERFGCIASLQAFDGLGGCFSGCVLRRAGEGGHSAAMRLRAIFTTTVSIFPRSSLAWAQAVWSPVSMSIGTLKMPGNGTIQAIFTHQDIIQE